jgi:hypothetical protein
VGPDAGRIAREERTVERALYAAAQALSTELGDAAWAAYRLGDEALREIVDITFDAAGLSASALLTRASDWTGQAQETGTVLGGGIDRIWKQARNNFEVYGLVKNVRSRLHLDWDRPFDLGALVRAAYGLGAYADLWALEGLGHDYAAMCLDRQGARSGILRDGPASTLPPGSLTMMHAGLGLALAERMVPQLTPFSPAGDFRRASARFVAACQAHSRQGYVGAAYESLGLVVRTWHPLLVPRLEAALLDLDPGVAGFFWHGAGRALYFLPAYIVPGLLSPWRAADREAPHDLAHRNLHAGLAWATTLVNIRHPQVMIHLLEVRGDALVRSAGFVNGIASAIVVGIDTTPDDPFVLAFAGYDPAAARPRARDLWNTAVRPAVLAAIERYHPLLSRGSHLDLVFRYGDLERIASRLERGEALEPTGTPSRAPAPAPPVRPAAPPPGLYPAAGRAGGRSR